MRTQSSATLRSRTLRKNQTLAEGLIWQQLRAKKFGGIKFKRQQPIGKYIVDFVSFEKMIIIEIDGGQHNKDKEMNYDEIRTKYLESLGYRVFRFWNNDILNNLNGVFEKIRMSIPSL